MSKTVRPVLSLIQLVAVLILIGLILEPQLPNRISQFDTTIRGGQAILEGTVKDRQGIPLPHVTVAVVHEDGTPYKNQKGNPVRSITDNNGEYKVRATVKDAYRIEIIIPHGKPDRKVD